MLSALQKGACLGRWCRVVLSNLVGPAPLCSVHQRSMAAGRLENVTQTISRILEGYDIRLRPNFGGKCGGGDSAGRQLALTV